MLDSLAVLARGFSGKACWVGYWDKGISRWVEEIILVIAGNGSKEETEIAAGGLLLRLGGF